MGNLVNGAGWGVGSACAWRRGESECEQSVTYVRIEP